MRTPIRRQTCRCPRNSRVCVCGHPTQGEELVTDLTNTLDKGNITRPEVAQHGLLHIPAGGQRAGPGNEGSIELYDADRKLPQQAQGGVARSEVVDCNGRSQSGKILEVTRLRSDVAHQAALRHLELYLVTVQRYLA